MAAIMISMMFFVISETITGGDSLKNIPLNLNQTVMENPLRVLICEDNVAAQMLLARALQGIGYEVIVDPTGDIAFEVIRDRAPDLIITDLNMPSVSGFEVIEYARRKQDKRIPIVVLTNMSFDETYDQAMELGADVFLTKPFDLASLIETVKSLEVTY